MTRYLLVLATDCGGSDEGRSLIAASRCFYPHDVFVPFFATASMETLHCGFIAAAHALSTIDHFGPLRDGEKIGILVNAAPRHGTENGETLRGASRKRSGEEIYALLLDNGVWVVGPNADFNFFFLRDRVRESYLVVDRSGAETPFRSLEVMIPALADRLGARTFENLTFEPKALPVFTPEPGIFVADWDNHDNLYLVSTRSDESWIPPLGEERAFRVGSNLARLRHVDGIFAGKTGEQTLTTGSLKLNGKPVHYVVVVGSKARAMLGNPAVGTKVVIEDE